MKPIRLSALLAALAISSPAVADTVATLNDDGSPGIPYSDVQIQEFRDGQVVFVLPTGNEATVPLGSVGSLSVDGLPLLQEARADAEAARDREAIAKLRTLQSNAGGRAWVETHAKKLLVPLLDRTGQGTDAVPLYLDLVEAGLPSGYLPPPPVASAATMSDSVRSAAVDRARRAAQANPSAAPALEQIIAIMGGTQTAAADPAPDGTPDTGGGGLTPALPAPPTPATPTPPRLSLTKPRPTCPTAPPPSSPTAARSSPSA